jgi:hypothetical protein
VRLRFPTLPTGIPLRAEHGADVPTATWFALRPVWTGPLASMLTDIGTVYSRDELWDGVVAGIDDPDDTTVRLMAVSSISTS